MLQFDRPLIRPHNRKLLLKPPKEEQAHSNEIGLALMWLLLQINKVFFIV